jgi:hypothetical protein
LAPSGLLARPPLCNTSLAHDHPTRLKPIELVAGGIAEKILFPDRPPLRAEHDKIKARAVAAIACASLRSVDGMLAYIMPRLRRKI